MWEITHKFYIDHLLFKEILSIEKTQQLFKSKKCDCQFGEICQAVRHMCSCSFTYPFECLADCDHDCVCLKYDFDHEDKPMCRAKEHVKRYVDGAEFVLMEMGYYYKERYMRVIGVYSTKDEAERNKPQNDDDDDRYFILQKDTMRIDRYNAW